MWRRVTSEEQGGNLREAVADEAAGGALVARYRFGPFELDTRSRELRRAGVTVALQPQPYRALQLLVAARGRVIAREDFIEALWEPGTHVDFDRGIISTIRRLRDVLGDEADEPRFIRTVPGHGYLFVAEVDVAAVADHAASHTGPTEPGRARSRWLGRLPRWGEITLGTGIVAATIVGAVTLGPAAKETPPASVALDRGVAEQLAAARFHAYRGGLDGYRAAAAAYEAALDLKPNLADAWVGLAESQAALGIWFELPNEEVLPRARRATRRALALDPGLAEAHAVAGLLSLYYDWDWEQATESLERALALDPGSANASSWRAAVHTVRGNHDAAITAALEALLLNPMSESVTAGAGWTYLYAGRYQDAIRHCRQTYDIVPDHPRAKTCLIHAYEALGQPVEEFEQLGDYALASLGPERFATLAAKGPAEATREYWEILFKAYAVDGSRPWRTAVFGALANRPEDAFEWLEVAYETRAPQLVYLQVDPRFEALRADPRFADLASRIGLPA